MSRWRPPKAHEPFVVEVAALRREPGSARRVSLAGPMTGLGVPTSTVAEGEPVCIDALLESVSEGILVTGVVRARWEGECRRCLERATGPLEVEVRELCVEEPDDEETTYRLDGDLLDLAPLVHDACILELPLAPLCSEECLGICAECGANRNAEACACVAPVDPRWGALAALGESERPEEKK
ncbi:MAG TPA: DUF177 domain-containing protein [Acidimicrobiales bacterium]|nr:DUF177 domain-containing protein [Acidimicrobiales bacterium]